MIIITWLCVNCFLSSLAGGDCEGYGDEVWQSPDEDESPQCRAEIYHQVSLYDMVNFVNIHPTVILYAGFTLIVHVTVFLVVINIINATLILRSGIQFYLCIKHMK